MEQTPLPLTGCTPTPLAGYLKALGVLRLLSEQQPAATAPRGGWQGETFVLHGTQDREAIVEFFLHRYRPTPILAPWNGGSGFYLREGKTEAIDAATGKRAKTGLRTESTAASKTLDDMAASTAPRFALIRDCIEVSRQLLHSLRMESAPKEEAKSGLLLRLRGALPAAALESLDAAYVLLHDSAKPPPLLGTGLNDGNLDFSSNFLQSLATLFDLGTGNPIRVSRDLLATALFGDTLRGLQDSAIGQFHPHAAGGPNTTSGFDGRALVNPWDLVLMLEGALLFAAAAVKRSNIEAGSGASFPFCVRPSDCGYPSAALADSDARGEFWAPLWSQPICLAELRQILGEGRASLRHRAARDGLEFSRAVARLGIDRGLSGFQRYSFAPRNGRAFMATPLDRIQTRARPQASSLIDELENDGWLDRVRRAARADRAPSRVRTAVRRVEAAIMALLVLTRPESDESTAVETLLLLIAELERILSRSQRWSTEQGLRPIRTLGSTWWHRLGRRERAELDLAAGLASLRRPHFRTQWEPIQIERGMPQWAENRSKVVWNDHDLTGSLIAVHRHRILAGEAPQTSIRPTYFVRAASLERFLDGDVDDRLMARWARALSLLELPPDADRSALPPSGPTYASVVARWPVSFGLPCLALAGHAPRSDDPMPRLPALLRRGETGDGHAVSRLAAQRLRASGFTPAVRICETQGPGVKRAVAATIFPLARPILDALADRLAALETTN